MNNKETMTNKEAMTKEEFNQWIANHVRVESKRTHDESGNCEETKVYRELFKGDDGREHQIVGEEPFVVGCKFYMVDLKNGDPYMVKRENGIPLYERPREVTRQTRTAIVYVDEHLYETRFPFDE